MESRHAAIPRVHHGTDAELSVICPCNLCLLHAGIDRRPPGKLKALSRKLNEEQPTDAELAAVGLKRSDFGEADETEVWPENWPVLRLFDAMRTQWRVSYGGAYGFDYAALPAVMDLLQPPDRLWAFEGLRVMEAEALEIMHKDK